jgi:hypothetical protein
MRGIISRLRSGRICRNLDTLAVCRPCVVRRRGGCMLHKKINYRWYTRIHGAATYSLGIPCLGKRGLLNLRGRSGDGSGR